MAASRVRTTTSRSAPSCRRRPSPSSRVNLVMYAGASGDFNLIHWNERVAKARRPARRHRARHVHDGRGRPGGHRLGRRPGRRRRVRRPLLRRSSSRTTTPARPSTSAAGRREARRRHASGSSSPPPTRRDGCSAGPGRSSGSDGVRGRLTPPRPFRRAFDDHAARRPGRSRQAARSESRHRGGAASPPSRTADAAGEPLPRAQAAAATC